MPYDEEGRFIYPKPARKPKPKDKDSSPKKNPTTSPKSSKMETPPVAPHMPVTPVPAKSLPEEVAAPSKAPTAPPKPVPAKPVPVAPVRQIRPSKLEVASEINPSALSQFDSISENDLALLWNAQRWPQNVRLETSTGESIEVIYRGRWSGGFGPDFKGALISLGGELRSGDVELHLKTSGWKAHGHQQDPRYNNVVLQVVFEDDVSDIVQTQAGNSPALFSLRKNFKSEEALLQALEEARSSDTKLGSISESEGPCCEQAGERAPDLEKLLREVDKLGEQRFIEKAGRYEADCAAGLEGGPAQVFWTGLLEALGYSQNKAPFRQLAAVLPLATVLELEQSARRRSEPFEERVLSLEAALLGAAGLLPGQRRPRKQPDGQMSLFDEPGSAESSEILEDWAAGVYVDELERRWNWLERQIRAGTIFASMKEKDWTFARLRPPNHPSRRIAGLARLVARWPATAETDLLEWLAGRLANGTPEEQNRQLTETFRSELDDRESESGQFWARRFDFAPRALMVGDNAKGAASDLIGLDRAADIAVNVALPFLYGYGSDQGNELLQKAVLAAYRVHPKLGSNELVENVARQVFRYWLEKPGEIILSGKPVKKLTAGRLIETACRQQGLIYLHHRYCASQDYVACPLRGMR